MPAPPSVVVRWDRSNGPPATLGDTPSNRKGQDQPAAMVLWCAGFLANRSELVKLASIDPGVSDRSIVEAMYPRYGANLARLITGTFSWILWDRKRYELIAARDRTGNFGLYYVSRARTVWIASQVEPLLNCLPTPPRLNHRSIVAFINQLTPRPCDTFYTDIHRVEPGNVFSVSRAKIASSPYWRVEAGPPLQLPSDNAYAERYRELLFDTVRKYSASSQPVGLTLSGGLDSTSIAAALRSVDRPTRITAISWITPELPEADETRSASAVAKRLRLQTVPIRADLHWPLSARGRPITYADAPPYGYYRELWDATFQEMQRQGIKKLFSGHGGDDLFGCNAVAYPDLLLTGHWWALMRQLQVHTRDSPLTLLGLMRHKVLAPVICTYLPNRRKIPQAGAPWLKKTYHRLYREHVASLEKRGLEWCLPGRCQRLQLLREPTLPLITEEINLHAARFGIEFRHPLLDHRLLEFAARLPTTQTFRAGVNKIIVRHALAQHLPKEILECRQKTLPIAIFHRGLREREQSKAWALMSNMRAAHLGFVDENALRQEYRDYLAGKHQQTLFWNTLSLETWLRQIL